MAIHLTKLLPLTSRISNANLWSKKPRSLASFVSRRHLQEFPDLRLNNVVPQDHVLVLPEVLNEQPSNNELLRLPKFGEPEINFSKLNTFLVYKGLSQTICSFEDFLTDIEDEIISISDKSFSELFEEFEKQIYPMDNAYNILMILTSVDSSNYKYMEINQLIERYLSARDKRLSGKVRVQIQTYIKRDYANLSEDERRLLQIYHGKSVERVFLKPGDEKTLSLYHNNLQTDKMRFKYNLNSANLLFSHTVDDPDILTVVAPEFEDCQELHHKERTPLKITLATYQKFMRVCPDRFIRKNLWLTRNKRCSPKALPKLNNLSIIGDIRNNRRTIADISGYRSHVESKLDHAVAQSKQDILEGLEFLNDENLKKLNDRLRELNDYAADNSFEDPSQLGIQEYDVDFWSHKYKYEILIGTSEVDLKAYFPFETVMKGLQAYFRNYFDINLESSKQNQDNRFWGEGIEVFQVIRGDKPTGSIIFDPHHRADKRQNPFYARLRGRNQSFESLPARVISMPFKMDRDSKQIHLSVTDVINLFYCYGIVIQRLLYNYDYYELNTYGGLELEVNDLLPNLVVAHLLTDRKILQSCSDRGNSKPIDSDLAIRILKALTYFKCFETWNQLYQARLDIETHTTQTDIKTIVKDIYPIYSPFNRDPDDYDFCAMEDIFVGPNDGSRYAELWSKQLANFFLLNDISSMEQGKIKDFNSRLLDALFDRKNLKLQPKLPSLVGRSFEASKTSLGVL